MMKRTVCSLLALLMLAGVLVSCSDGGTQDDVTTVTDADETTAADVEVGDLDVVKDGATVYKIICPDNASDEVKHLMVELNNKLKEVYGVSAELGTDFEMRGFDIANRYKYEILVGATNREESADAVARIRYTDFVITVANEKLVITGGSDKATVQAVEYFIENYIKGDALSIPRDTVDLVANDTEKGTLTVAGKYLSEYTVVYAARYKASALALCNRIGTLCGAVMTCVSDNTEVEGAKIVVGSTKIGSDAPKSFAGPDDYKVAAKDGNIVISAGTDYAIGMGCNDFLETLAEKDKLDYALTDFDKNFTLPGREVYINDISKLPLHWSINFDVPDWMTDFDEKYAAMTDPDGRLMSNAHRGDSVYYPENSIEGYISAIRMGTDMIETDPRLTKDGVFVIMHDATLNRMTDWEEKHGLNGLPDSLNLADWTYEQLMQLNLKTGNGGSGASVTPYKIPTLDEVFHVCAGRVFIRLDVKGPETTGLPYWDYVRDIWPLEVKYNSYDNVIFTWHSFFTKNSYSLIKEYKKKQIAACGRASVFYIGCGASGVAKNILTNIRNNGFDYCVRLTDMDLTVSYKDYLKSHADRMSEFKGAARVYIDAAGGTPHSDNVERPEYWQGLYDGGITFLLTNKSYELCKYIAENFTPAEYSK